MFLFTFNFVSLPFPMVSWLTSAVHHGFYPKSCQTKTKTSQKKKKMDVFIAYL